MKESGSKYDEERCIVLRIEMEYFLALLWFMIRIYSCKSISCPSGRGHLGVTQHITLSRVQDDGVKE
jgi:hypothetical protein